MAEVGRERAAWAVLFVVAGAIAVAAIVRWVWAVTLGGPVLYSEGAVAHAALLARDARQYAAGATLPNAEAWSIFVAANYPPLFFRVAGLGDPFVVGRVASIVSTFCVAGAIAWHAWPSGALRALALSLAWLATFPVIVWGAALKPDLVALALTVAAVISIDKVPVRLLLVPGALLALAIFTKPTAALPAIALVAWSVRQGVPPTIYLVFATLFTLAAVSWDPWLSADMIRHVVTWNALSWRPDQAALLLVIAAVAFGALAIAAIIRRRVPGPVAAYGAGALGIAVLGGREGATINYLLDLSAASALAVASTTATVGVRFLPLILAAQLVVAVGVFDPFGMTARGGTGAWANPDRIGVVRSLPAGPALVEDSGLLLANGRAPVVDDLFLWSRLYALANDSGMPFVEGERLLASVREQQFVAIVSEFDLARIAEAPGYERARWHPHLVDAVLGAYALERSSNGLWVYRPR